MQTNRRKSRRRRWTTLAVAAVTFAAVLANTGSATAASVNSVRSWSAGTLAPGESKTYTWNNANSDLYQANTAAVRTDDPDVDCAIEMTRQWYRRGSDGSRKFMFTIANVSSRHSCDVTVYLAIITADRSGGTGVINPGQTWSTRWNNANPDRYVYLAGVTPSAPYIDTCQLEVTWRVRAVPGGEREFLWFIRNVGTVACEGQWRLGWLPVDHTSPDPFEGRILDPTHRYGLASSVMESFRVYVFGLIPVATSAGNCDLAPTHQQMVGDPTVPSPSVYDMRTSVGWRLVGVPCVVAGVTKAYIR